MWMMQYQFADDAGNVFESLWPGTIRNNWETAGEVKPGDWLVAYLPTNTFYAIGRVIKSRCFDLARQYPGTIADYLNRKRSHDYKSGYVSYTPVLYEDFTDPWRDPRKPIRRPQRIDVEQWEHYVPDGAIVKGLADLARNELRKSIFEIGKEFFDKIKRELAVEAVGSTVVEDLEERHATRSQGFVVDSKLRNALEEYAMEVAKRYFESKKYKWKDHHKTCSYDLLCTRGQEVLYVEVKGTVTAGEAVFLTANEVRFARENRKHMVLFVLHSINVSPGKDGYVLSGGEHRRIQPWNVDRGTLKPLAYKYELPT
jgi:hypothetical protein